MGDYIYRVTAKKVKLADGREARVAEFAYKPYGGFGGDRDKLNRKMHFESGAAASDRAAADGRYKDTLMVLEEDTSRVFLNKPGYGTFYDFAIGGDRLPRVT